MNIKTNKAFSSIFSDTTLDVNSGELQVSTSNLRHKTLSVSLADSVHAGSGSGDGVWPEKKKTEAKSRSGSGDGVWPNPIINNNP